ncbi:MAG: MBL fold metallo-hydrolase [Proteobacteria bacterium]|nr:MBL fold metallo-hydrolase [Pseudomonadota bacterium]
MGPAALGRALHHVVDGARYLATAARARASDHVTARQLAWPAHVALPVGLSLTWYGTAGFRLAYQDTVVWIDPYVTRFGLGDLARRRAVPSASALVARHVDRADAILVGHTHFDHALDVPAIARQTGAAVYGSTALHHLMGLHGLAARAIVVAPQRDYHVGPFRIHFVPSVHSKLGLGLTIPFAGEITCEHVGDLAPQAYNCGQVWGIFVEVGGTTFYHQGSADLIDDEIRDRDVDVFLCGITGRRFTDRYVARIVRRLAPKVVVPTHFDDFFRPLDAPMEMSFNVNLTGFADEVHAASREMAIHALAIGVPIGR